MENNPLYYFNEVEKSFIKYDKYDILLSAEKQKFRPATFIDVRLHGSDELKEEIKPRRQAEIIRQSIWGPLA